MDSNVNKFIINNNTINEYGYSDKDYVENIIINIDSRNRDITLYPDEFSFKTTLDIKYKNIVSIALSSIELHNSNTISIIDSIKNNNYILLYFPDRYQDTGFKIMLEKKYSYADHTSTLKDYDNICIILNSLISKNKALLNSNYNFFYINTSYVIISNQSNVYNYTLNSGLYSVNGLIKIFVDWFTTIKISNFIIKSFILNVTPNIPINFSNMSFDNITEFSNNITNTLNLSVTMYKYTDLYNVKFYTSSNNIISVANSNYYFPTPLTPQYIIQNNTIGLNNGVYKYMITYFSYNTTSSKISYFESEPSNSITVTINSNYPDYGQTVTLTNLLLSSYSSPNINYGINIYRTKANALVYYLLGSITNETEYNDDKDDSLLVKQYIKSNLNIPTYNPPFVFKNLNAQFELAFEPTIYFNQNDKYPTLGYYMGFRKDIYTIINPVSAEKLANFAPNRYVFININDWGFISLMNKKVLAKILLPLFNSNIVNELQNKRYDFVQPINIYDLHIQLLDYLGNPIDLCGKDFSFSLILSQIKNSKLIKQ